MNYSIQNSQTEAEIRAAVRRQYYGERPEFIEQLTRQIHAYFQEVRFELNVDNDGNILKVNAKIY